MKFEFIISDNGAVTVDWVVLTAALVGLGLAAMGVVSSGAEDVSADINSEMQSGEIIQTSFVNLPAISRLYRGADAVGNVGDCAIWTEKPAEVGCGNAFSAKRHLVQFDDGTWAYRREYTFYESFTGNHYSLDGAVETGSWIEWHDDYYANSIIEEPEQIADYPFDFDA